MLKKLRVERDDYKVRIRKAFDAMTAKDSSITPDDYAENKARYDKEIVRIDQQLERLEEADKNFYTTASYLLVLFKHGDKIFEAANDEEKRQLLTIVLSNLKLNGKIVLFTPNEPFATVLKLTDRSLWQGLQGSNLRPSVLETDALPTELNPYAVNYSTGPII